MNAGPNLSGNSKNSAKKKGLGTVAYTAIFLLIAVLGALAVISFARPRGTRARDSGASAQTSPPVETSRLLYANAETPGMRIKKADFIGNGKPTIFYFHSKHCQYCDGMTPLVERLAQVDSSRTIVQVELDRQTYDGIDYHSPVGEQFDIHSVPSFAVYDANGQLLAQGKEAKPLVRQIMFEKKVAN